LPRISVIIPAFNAAPFLRPCLDSALAQLYRDIEIILVDDGSTDNTADIAGEYGTRIRYIRKENGGTSSALNAGIRNANGEYLAWLSADDVYLPTKLERQMAQLEHDPALKVLHTGFHVIDGSGKIVNTILLSPSTLATFSPLTLIKHDTINGSTILFHRDCLASTGFFDESIQGTEDWDMWIRMACFFPFGYIAEPLICYRWHDSNFSHKRDRINQAAWKMVNKALAYPPFLKKARVERGWKAGEACVPRVCVEIAEAYLKHPVHVDLVPQLLWKSILASPWRLAHYRDLVRLARRYAESISWSSEGQSRSSRTLLQVALFVARPNLYKRLKRRLIAKLRGAHEPDEES
jgi:teichuronic acid biosynthesis glycosyltransferase TuaG